jgi:hypothetical protein
MNARAQRRIYHSCATQSATILCNGAAM